MEAKFQASKKIGSGKLLLSEPFLKDAYFSRSVVLLAEHNTEGSFGLILNKPIGMSINQLLPDFPAFDAKVYLGGPVKPDNIFFLHTLGDKIANSMPVRDNIYFGGDIEKIREMIILNQITANDIKFFVGYAGWTPNQLDEEFKEKSWLLVDYKDQNIMSNLQLPFWNNILKQMGTKYVTWALAPLDPQLN